MERFCDEDCNNCPIVGHKNSRQLTLLLNILYDKFGDDVLEITNDICPNFTVCYDCRIDDFCHIEHCKIISELDKE